jgi:TPP-dependent pyruvate/acetoin dehydrogenase alpha subunit
MIKHLNLRLYKNILRYRLVELEIAKEYQNQLMRCPTHLSIGQEAVSAAFAELANKKDFAVSSHRAHIHYLAKGGNLKKMIAEIYGKKNGCSKGKGGSMHLIDLNVNFMGSSAIVGNSIPIGTGLGLSATIKKTNQKSFIFFGDGAIEQGAFYESINFAAVRNLPTVFVCENNLYSVYSPLKDRQPKNRKIFKMINSIGLKSYSCDGNNVVSCYNTFSKALKFVEKKKKPVFLEFYTYRHFEHCGPNIDDNLNYRSTRELNFWKKKDPLEISKKKLKKNELIRLNQIEKTIKKEIKEAFDYAKKSPYPNIKSAFEDVYG